MGGSQNYGPLLVLDYNTASNIWGYRNRTLVELPVSQYKKSKQVQAGFCPSVRLLAALEN